MSEAKQPASRGEFNYGTTSPQAQRLRDAVPKDLARYLPPWRDRRFWVVQLIVVVIAGMHDVIEVGGYLPHFGMLYFVPISLFFVPVVYAALNFGFPGAVATALWATAITIPNWVFWHHGLERVGVIFQMSIVIAVAVFVGYRVEMESRARREAVMMGIALQASEARYRGLFETAGESVLIVDDAGYVLEANEAAGDLFDTAAPLLRGQRVRSLLSTEMPEQHGGAGDDVLLHRSDGTPVHLQPLSTSFTDLEGHPLTQLILQDVTVYRRRQEGLRTYAAQVLRAQEEERQRIAQELHDETIQSLMVICRQLDEMQRSCGQTPTNIADRLNVTRRDTLDVTEALRRITRGLRPPILDDLGLPPAVRRVAMELAERTGIHASWNVSGTPYRLPSDIELGVFRIAQEALHNVERHAHAANVALHLVFEPAVVRLTVSDDGVGFEMSETDEEHFTEAGRLGLTGMQERARLVGGSFRIHSAVGKGTTVEVELPTGAATAATPA